MKSFSFKLVLFSLVSGGFLSFFIVKKTTNAAFQSPKIEALKSLNSAKGVAVLELYTSEGCSSCPAADDVLRGMGAQENVFPLAFSIKCFIFFK